MGIENSQHLVYFIKKYYEVPKDWVGKLYCGITMDWYYKNGTVNMSTLGYIESSFTKIPPKK